MNLITLALVNTHDNNSTNPMIDVQFFLNKVPECELTSLLVTNYLNLR